MSNLRGRLQRLEAAAYGAVDEVTLEELVLYSYRDPSLPPDEVFLDRLLRSTLGRLIQQTIEEANAHWAVQAPRPMLQ